MSINNLIKNNIIILKLNYYYYILSNEFIYTHYYMYQYILNMYHVTHIDHNILLKVKLISILN